MRGVFAVIVGIVMQIVALVAFKATPIEGFYAYLLGSLIGTQLNEREAK